MGHIHVFAACALVVLMYYVTLQGVLQNSQKLLMSAPSKPDGMPDFSYYEPMQILSADEFPIDDPNRRVIIVGDIHGMIQPLRTLLKRVSYDPHTDVLVHVGDFVAKGPRSGSKATLAFMAAHNITGVRGNHDQQVIEWRGWIDWIMAVPEGRRWLETLHRRWEAMEKEKAEVEVEKWVEWERQKAFGGSVRKGKGRKNHDGEDAEWWARVPEGWKLFSDQYMIASALTSPEYAYLKRLPLRIYVPSAHTYIVHAGLLPSDPRYPYYDKQHQPLARVPKEKHLMLNGAEGWKPDPSLRRAQELALLTQVPQNTDPWVTLNIRGVIGHKVTRNTKKGKPWFKLWKRDMAHCKGFDADADTVSRKDHALPCYPSTVIYGHAASRGLNVQRWTFGLDSGCVYERKLTALVIGPNATQPFLDASGAQDYDFADDDDEDEEEDEDSNDRESPKTQTKNKKNNMIVPFGDKGQARIVKVNCRR